jgi:ribose transport system ATP-binding protein
MEEIFRVADRYSVLRNGKTVGSGNIKDVTEKDLVRLMIDKDSIFGYARAGSRKADKPVCLKVTDLKTDLLQGISFDVREGELVGIGGLRGQGQRDLLLSLFGARDFLGTVEYKGNAVHFRRPSQAIRQGFALVPGDRAKEGLLYIRSILENMQLPSWSHYGFPLKIGRARKDAEAAGRSLNLKMASLLEPVSSLSGGNAQKVVIGKWLMRQPALLLLDDPTKGVDVGTKAEFYALLTELCQQGKTILFNSSEDEELVGLCDRVLVLHDGRIKTELEGKALTKENLISASMGVTKGSSQ